MFLIVHPRAFLSCPIYVRAECNVVCLLLAPLAVVGLHMVSWREKQAYFKLIIFLQVLNPPIRLSLVYSPIKQKPIFSPKHCRLSHSDVRCKSFPHIDNGLNVGKITPILALDLRAVFDMVWHDDLVHKLFKLGFNTILVKTIRNMLTSRSFFVRLGEYVSPRIKMVASVSQGSVSGSTIFNLYMHDLPSQQNLKCIQFTDDSTFYATHDNHPRIQNDLNVHLVHLHKFFDKWKLNLNSNKTGFINIICMDTNPSLRRRAKKIIISSKGHESNHAPSIRLF